MLKSGDEELKENLISENESDKNNEIMIPDSIESNFNINKAMEKAGDLGFYQMTTVLFLSLVWMVVPSIPIMIPFYRIIPDEMCMATSNPSELPHQCTKEEFCNSQVTKISSQENFHNWATDFRINCENEIYYGFLASIYFIGILIGFFFVSSFSDKYGRKKVLIFSISVYFCLSFCIYFFSTFQLLFIYLLVIGIIYSGTSMCAFVLIFESTSIRNKAILTTIISMSFGIGAIFNIFMFYIFQDWETLVLIGGILSLVLILFKSNLQESPELLNNKKKYSELKNVLEFIATRNNKSQELKEYLEKSEYENLIKKEEYLKTIDKEKPIMKTGVLNILTLKNERLRIVLMSFNWFVMTLTFYGMNFDINNFGLNNYMAGIVVYLSEVVAQFVSMFVVLRIGDTYSVVLFYFMAGFSLVLLNFITLSASSGLVMTTLYTILIFSGKFGIASINNVNYIYSGRLFPVEIRMGALSFFKIISRLGAVCSTILLEVSSFSLLIFGLLCLVISVLILLFTKSLEKSHSEPEEANSNRKNSKDVDV